MNAFQNIDLFTHVVSQTVSAFEMPNVATVRTCAVTFTI
jgi:hypothetical protein